MLVCVYMKAIMFPSIILYYWGEPERAPHLMMSTAVCMFVCLLSFVVRTANICLRTSYGNEW